MKKSILILLLISVFVGITYSQARTITLRSGAKIRESSSPISKIIKEINYPTIAQILSKSTCGYYKVECDGIVGFVNEMYIKKSITEKEYVENKNGKVKACNAKIRKLPNPSSNIIKESKGFSYVQILSRKYHNGYYKVDQSGVVGYLNELYLDKYYHYKFKQKQINRNDESGFENPRSFIEEYANDRINNWQRKREFEKTEKYLNRIKNRKQYITQCIDSAKLALNEIYSKNVDWSKRSISIYDADSESFQLYFDKYGPLVTKVAIDDAAQFKKEFNALIIKDAEFDYVDDKWSLIKFNILSEIQYNFATYDVTASTTYQPADIAYNFDKPDIVIASVHKGLSSEKKTMPVINVGKSDVDIAIPVSDWQKTNTFALIIGNEDYSSYQKGLAKEVNVDYATNDAQVFSKYINQTIGVPMENITLLINATGNQTEQAIDKLSKLAKHSNGKAELIFYYAGHGLPHQQTKEPYLIPVDVSGANIEYGVELNKVYAKLTEYPCKRVLVFLDACFSGGARKNPLIASRGITITPKENYLKGNILVFASSSGNQVSSSWEDRQHGLFTYFLLKKIKESKGDLYLSELYNYLKQSVPLKAITINKPEQEPKLKTSFQIEDVWHTWKLK